MKNIQLIALITGAAVLAGAPALILPAIFRAPRPRLSPPDSKRKSRKIPNSKSSTTPFRRIGAAVVMRGSARRAPKMAAIWSLTESQIFGRICCSSCRLTMCKWRWSGKVKTMLSQ